MKIVNVHCRSLNKSHGLTEHCLLITFLNACEVMPLPHYRTLLVTWLARCCSVIRRALESSHFSLFICLQSFNLETANCNSDESRSNQNCSSWKGPAGPIDITTKVIESRTSLCIVRSKQTAGGIKNFCNKRSRNNTSREIPNVFHIKNLLASGQSSIARTSGADGH